MKSVNHTKSITFLLLMVLAGVSEATLAAPETDSAMPVDLVQSNCLLPGQVRKLGAGLLYVTQRRAVKIDINECHARGGDFFAFSEKK